MARKRAPTLEVPVYDLVLAVGTALDLMDPALRAHHLRVATVAVTLGRRVGLPPDRLQDLAIAASLHDAGGFSLGERLDTLAFEVTRPEHAETGWRILRGFAPFTRAAAAVRHHHLPWEGGRGEHDGDQPVPVEAHLLQLADRCVVLLREGVGAITAGRAALERLRAGAGETFVPELVRALEDTAKVERFWLDAAEGNPAVVAEAIPESARLGLGELKGLGRVLERLVDFRSRFTATHSSGVAAVARQLAAACALDEATASEIELAAALHDIGKLAVPGEILDAEPALDGRALDRIRAHPYHGWRVLGRVRGFERVAAWASYHHERLDGSGYPFRLSAAEIPFGSRLVAVADVFTALTEERPYRRGRCAREAAEVLAAEAAAGALDAGLVAAAVRDRDDLDAVRRAAQRAAGQRFLELRTRPGARELQRGAPAA